MGAVHQLATLVTAAVALAKTGEALSVAFFVLLVAPIQLLCGVLCWAVERRAIKRGAPAGLVPLWFACVGLPQALVAIAWWWLARRDYSAASPGGHTSSTGLS